MEYLLQQLQQQKVVSDRMILLGYSMGGTITCEIAIRRNIKLAGMVLLSSGGDLKNHTPMLEQLKAMPVELFKTEEIVGGVLGTDTSEAETETDPGIVYNNEGSGCDRIWRFDEFKCLRALRRMQGN